MSRIVVLSAVRTPIGKAGRAYAGVHAVDLLATSLRAAVERAAVDPELVDQVVVGCTQQAGDQAVNVARNGWLAAGLPDTPAATTVDTQCGSSQQAVSFAAGLLATGQADVVVAGGVEALSRVPMFLPAQVGSGEPYSPAQLARYDMPHQGVAAERLAAKYGIDRREADAFGVRSHLRAHAAWEAGRFDDEVVPVLVDGAALLTRDEGIRPDSTPERAAALSPVYAEGGVVTAAAASQISDGSSALVLATQEAATRMGLEPLAAIRRSTAVGVDPELMLEGPIVAARRLLETERLTLRDIDLVEVHEAYAVVARAWLRAHPYDEDRLNPDGGAISLGHPFGASGGRQLGHLIHTLHREGLRLGMSVMCCGGGIGTGTIVEAA